MILCVCLNPALDITYRVPALQAGASHTVHVAAERAGGKGVNVARVLTQAGVPATVAGFCGGRTGEALTRDFPAEFTPIRGETRRSVAVIDGASATVFNEPGPSVDFAEWEAFLGSYQALLDGSEVVALSGSLPPRVPVDAYAQLTRLADGRPVIVDAKGDALRAALDAGPAVVAPNRHEATSVLGHAATALEAAQELRKMGAADAVVSDGAAGFAASTVDGCWRISTPRVVRGNPTGAGDALTAALADGLRSGREWPEILCRAAAWSVAAVAVDHAGEIDEALAAELQSDVEVRPCP